MRKGKVKPEAHRRSREPSTAIPEIIILVVSRSMHKKKMVGKTKV